MRTKNSIRNVSWGIIYQIFYIISTFVIRTIFIRTLGLSYLGLNSLYTNIITILSFVELGFAPAMVFSLYKPLKDNDQERIKSLIAFYKKIYHILALVILAIGLLLIPFLQYIVNLETPINNYMWFFLLFLINTFSSYFLIYKSTIINADQKIHIMHIIRLISGIIKMILQLIVLIKLKNYTLYLVIQIASVILNNIFLTVTTNKLYPYLKNDKSKTIANREATTIQSNIKSLFFYKLGSVLIDSTDNILISIIIGTIWVGYYSNYLMIISAIISIITIIFQSLLSSVGNFNVTNSKDKQTNVLYLMTFLNNIVFGICSVCLLLLINDFIFIWLGPEMILSFKIVLVIILNFYLSGLINPIVTFRDTTGLFKETKYVLIVTAIINITLSIILGIYFGLFGILIATLISKVISSLWYEPYVIVKKYLQESISKYYLKQLLWITLTTISLVINYFILKYLNLDLNIWTFILKVIIVAGTTGLIYILFNISSKELKEIIERIKKLFMK